ncbi:MAG: hypothetical protein ABWX61_07550 [Paenisporosarcina sp.]
MNSNREKELFSDQSHVLVSLNGVQVWVDNKFEDDPIAEQASNEIERDQALANIEKRNTH